MKTRGKVPPENIVTTNPLGQQLLEANVNVDAETFIPPVIESPSVSFLLKHSLNFEGPWDYKNGLKNAALYPAMHAGIYISFLMGRTYARKLVLLSATFLALGGFYHRWLSKTGWTFI